MNLERLALCLGRYISPGNSRALLKAAGRKRPFFKASQVPIMAKGKAMNTAHTIVQVSSLQLSDIAKKQCFIFLHYHM
jgi:hypothetical protein